MFHRLASDLIWGWDSPCRCPHHRSSWLRRPRFTRTLRPTSRRLALMCRRRRITTTTLHPMWRPLSLALDGVTGAIGAIPTMVAIPTMAAIRTTVIPIGVDGGTLVVGKTAKNEISQAAGDRRLFLLLGNWHS